MVERFIAPIIMNTCLDRVSNDENSAIDKR